MSLSQEADAFYQEYHAKCDEMDDMSDELIQGMTFDEFKEVYDNYHRVQFDLVTRLVSDESSLLKVHPVPVEDLRETQRVLRDLIKEMIDIHEISQLFYGGGCQHQRLFYVFQKMYPVWDALHLRTNYW